MFHSFLPASILSYNTTNFYMKNIMYVNMQNNLIEMINKLK